MIHVPWGRHKPRKNGHASSDDGEMVVNLSSLNRVPNEKRLGGSDRIPSEFSENWLWVNIPYSYHVEIAGFIPLK